MDNLYYEFLAMNNQLTILDYAQQSELFAVVEDKSDKEKYKVQRYVFMGQFSDADGTWYVLDFSDDGEVHRMYMLKDKMTWCRTEEEAKMWLWEKMANGALMR